jgi:phosphoribosylformylglycinamidine synthase
MAFAGELGAEIDLNSVPVSKDVKSSSRDDIILFSESNTRFIVEISRDNQSKFEEIMKGVVFGRIGESTSKHNNLIIQGLNNTPVVKADLGELKAEWKSTFKW